ncbi:hypothetical protein PPL_04425 [Heterostelium album PN500]|uniref:Uncharacterized protein n=1 Tax=Heterostelium pallidum (strain ATCC 26659 / Pp 5 / PN500) TaxID=670386 RepID=D3B7I7_HETP5|nr:hypothetical protein PPL_04425 [Heterostelium album PN500]EFA82730.1 hypothetical protein PPL_04425 [Heterostelium album PN500]|eukprot:XP_020434847.1 hypothetical protein PPL_04425 [Heterostelium album PN500]
MPRCEISNRVDQPKPTSLLRQSYFNFKDLLKVVYFKQIKFKFVRFEIDNSYFLFPLNPQDKSTRSSSYYHVDIITAKCMKEPCTNFSATELNT